MQHLMVEVAYVTCSDCQVECSGSGAKWTVPYRTDLEGWDSSVLGEAPLRSAVGGAGVPGVGAALAFRRPGH
jgi:hypothetical protein